MEALGLLIPLAAFFAVAVVGTLAWAVNAGQFEDLEGPAHRILLEEATGAVPPPVGVTSPTHRGGDATGAVGDDPLRLAGQVEGTAARTRHPASHRHSTGDPAS